MSPKLSWSRPSPEMSPLPSPSASRHPGALEGVFEVALANPTQTQKERQMSCRARKTTHATSNCVTNCVCVCVLPCGFPLRLNPPRRSFSSTRSSQKNEQARETLETKASNWRANPFFPRLGRNQKKNGAEAFGSRKAIALSPKGPGS